MTHLRGTCGSGAAVPVAVHSRRGHPYRAWRRDNRTPRRTPRAGASCDPARWAVAGARGAGRPRGREPGARGRRAGPGAGARRHGRVPGPSPPSIGARRGGDLPGGATVRVFTAILAKDLRVELRTLQSLPGMVLFAVTTFVLFRFGLDRTSLEGSLAAGVLLATVLFAAILAVNRVFVAERDQGGFDAIRLAPVDATAMFAAKAAGLIVYLLVLEAVTVPVFALFFLDDWAALPPLAVVLVLADIGLAATGALVSSLATGSRARDLLVPLL